MKKKTNRALLILLILLLSSVTGYTAAKYILDFPSDEAQVTFTAKLAENMTIEAVTSPLIPGDDNVCVIYTVKIKNKTDIPAKLTFTIVNNSDTETPSGQKIVAVDTQKLEASNTSNNTVQWTAVTSENTTTCTYYNEQLAKNYEDCDITLTVPLLVSQYAKQISATDTFTVSARLDEYVPQQTP